jgi:hypothetical protein
VTLKAGLQVVFYARTAILQRIMRATHDPGALGEPRWDVLPLLPLALSTAMVALGLAPVTVVLFGAAVLAVLSGILTLREAHDAIDLPILVLLACQIPISDAVAGTGGAELTAGGLATVAGALPPVGAVAPARGGHGADAVPHRLRRPIQCPPQHLSETFCRTCRCRDACCSSDPSAAPEMRQSLVRGKRQSRPSLSLEILVGTEHQARRQRLAV